MATHQISVLDSAVQLDSSGAVYYDIYGNHKAAPQYDTRVLIFESGGSSKIKVGAGLIIPQNYVGSAKFVIKWTANATTGDAEFDIEYRAIAIGETTDPTTDQETLNVADTAPATALDLLQVELTPTASNFAAGDLVLLNFGRDLSDAGDTLAADVILFKVLFEYADV